MGGIENSPEPPPEPKPPPESGGVAGGGALWEYGPLGFRNAVRSLGRMPILEPGNRATIIQAWNANDSAAEKGRNPADSLATPARITTTLQFSAPTDAAIMPTIRGTVRWGTAGGLVECEFDWGDGVQLGLTGSSFELEARHHGPLGELGVPVRVGAHIGYVGEGIAAVRTVELASMAAVNLIPIPRCAVGMRLQWADAGPPPAPIFAFNADLAGASLLVGPVVAPGGLGGGAGVASVPVPARARSVSVTGGVALPGIVVFDLSIGGRA